MAEPIDAVVFDFGGVLLDWDPRHLYGSVITDPAALEHFLTVVCPHSWHLQHDRGTPFTETLPVRQAEHPEHAELIALWGTRYDEMIGGEVPGSAAIVAELRRAGIALYGLTNLPGEVWPSVRANWPVTAGLDGVLVSGEEGIVKPDPAIFELLIDRFGLIPARTVFVDDVPVNVEAGRVAGLQALLFTDADQLRSDLLALGVALAASP